MNKLKPAHRAILVVCLVISGCREATPDLAPSARPNIVLIVMDTLRADRIHGQRNGIPVMPFLARMAEEGSYYRQAISPSSWTKPAVASLLTGVYANRHGVYHSARVEDPEHPTSDRLSDTWETLPEWLGTFGYTAWAFQTNANLTRALGFAQGYAEGNYLFSNGASAEAVTRAALDAFPALPKPFFLYAHYMDPHAPYHPDPSLNEVLGPLPALTEAERSLIQDDNRFMEIYLDQVKTAIGLQPSHLLPELSKAAKEAVRHRYDLECRAMDRSIEKLVESIRVMDPDTIFIFLADHGEEFWERSGMGHGVTLYQEQVHVPLIVVDGRHRGSVIDSPVSSMEILPWLATRLEQPPLTQWETVDNGFIYAETRGPWPTLGVNQTALFNDGYVCIRDSSHGTDALYRLDRDPAEVRNLSREEPERLDLLRSLIDRHLAESVPSAANAISLGSGDSEVLEALGYLDSAP